MASKVLLGSSTRLSASRKPMLAAYPANKSVHFSRGYSVKVAAIANLPNVFQVPGGKEAILCQKFQAHEAAVSQVLVLEDNLGAFNL